MYQLKSLEDTIVAISTPAGQGGIGMVRMSGSEALSIADKMFMSKGQGSPSGFKSHTVHYGWIVDKRKGGALPAGERGVNREIMDEVLLTVMRAPRTYTREDIVEISCHGGLIPLQGILGLAMDSGARLAEPGEFTKRAFLNGRMDLTQAEAVLDIIQSKTQAFLRVSTNQLKGDLTVQLEEIREHLMSVYVEIEAVVNFPEDTTGTREAAGDADLPPLAGQVRPLHKSKERVDSLLASSEQGKILKEGIRIVICGKANVGKSSLLNILLKQPRAIISKIEGTTRDTIEETARIKGIPFQLVDTAGILKPRDDIEEEALKRSHMHIQGADLVLLMLDAGQAISEEDEEIIEKVQGQNVLVILNKCDLDLKIESGKIDQFCKGVKVVRISALQRTGINELEDAVMENILHRNTIDTHGILISNMRHIHSLKNCASALAKANELLEKNQPVEFISEEIKRAVNALDQITGRNIDADLLDKIFSEFCIGK